MGTSRNRSVVLMSRIGRLPLKAEHDRRPSTAPVQRSITGGRPHDDSRRITGRWRRRRAIRRVAWQTDTRGHEGAVDPEPEQWGLRGDFPVWRRMRDLVAGGAPPATVEDGIRLLHDAFREVVGIELSASPADNQVFRPDLDSGGMSGGWVDLATWRQRLIPLLEARLSSARSERS